MGELDSAWKIAKGLFDFKHNPDEVESYRRYGYQSLLQRDVATIAVRMMWSTNSDDVREKMLWLTANGYGALAGLIVRMRAQRRSGEPF